MRPILILCATLAATTALAEEDSHGTLNPDEMTWQSMLDRAERGETGMVLCSTGYMLTKSGDHDRARSLFENCAQAGWTGVMAWMSQLDDNGLGGEYNPDASAKWNRRAAELGDPVGKFNRGLDLIRGHGVPRDDEAGRALVDEAARDGLPAAKRLQSAGYDLDVATPDADNWKYAPLF